jgi:mRNA-degrading endonuclease RelE of RelBE toxin-antitoxin system
MKYRLLVDLEAIQVLDSMTKKIRTRLIEHLAKMRDNPDRYSDYHEKDQIGRRVEISIFAHYAVHYWLDVPDRHIKILAIKPADQ